MKDRKIIDGVNVTKCEFFKPKYRHNLCTAYETDEYAAFCESKPNCFFKQLERLNNEYEGFAVKYTDMEMALKCKEEELEILKASYKTLLAEQTEIKKYLGISHKTILERLEELTDFRDADREQLDQLKAENEHLAEKEEEARHYLEEAYKLKQILQEIKEICKLAPKQTTCERCHTFGFPPEHELIRLILQKCEVIDDNDNNCSV